MVKVKLSYPEQPISWQ